MMKQERWEFRYIREGAEKVVFPKTKEQIEKNRDICKRNGFKVVSVKKMYPFNTERNQHNFMLISNVCANRMHDMDMGEIAYNAAEYERLESMKEQADKLFCADLPLAWFTWDDWKAAKELSELAIQHRMDKCIEAGHAEWVRYC